MSDSESDIQEKLKLNRKRRTIIEDDEDEDEDNLEEEEEEEGLDTYEKDDFMVDDDEVEDYDEEEEEEVHRKKIKKKKKIPDSEEELDEEDLDLIKENTGMDIEPSKTKLKRLQRKRESDYSEEDYENQDYGGLNDMFNDDDDVNYQEDEYGDGLDDFIEDDFGDEEVDQGEDPQVIMQRRNELRQKKSERLRKLRASGVDVEVHEVMLEIFGDGGDYDYAMFDPDAFRESNKEVPQSSLQAVFEPGELAARMLTETDEIIRSMDVPERMQERYADMVENKMTHQEIEEELIWVYNKFVETRSQAQAAQFSNKDYNDLVMSSIKACISFFNLELLEPPYIWAHRKDHFTDPTLSVKNLKCILSLSDIWTLYELDWKYKLFSRQLKEFNNNLLKYEKEGRVDDYVTANAKNVEKVEEIEDMIGYINANFGSRSAKKQSTTSFERCKQAGFDKLLLEFGISPEYFGVNVFEGMNIYHSQDHGTPPLEICAKYVCDAFPTPELVLNAAKDYIARQIANDLKVRRVLRSMFEMNAVISIQPTSKGVMEIDMHNRFIAFKYIDNKPIFSLRGYQFLEMLEAEERRLITIEISIPRKTEYTASYIRFYCGKEDNPHYEQWKRVRSDIIEKACYTYLYPHFEKWIREKLRISAEDILFNSVQADVEAKLRVGPYSNHRMPPNKLARVIALTNGTGQFNDPSVAVYLNSHGVVEEAIEFGDLRDEANRAILTSFFDSRPADVIIASGFDISVRYFVEKAKKVYSESQAAHSNPCDFITYTDEPARVYYLSDKASEEFPKYHHVIRYCISLARFVQNPLEEYAALEDEIMSINFHIHQSLLPQKLLESCINRAFINVINENGVDLHKAVSNKRISSQLKYVAGLGPRKAHNMIKKIQELGGTIDSRFELVTKRIMAKNIFINCSSFLKIIPSSEVLDSTRVHPEDYNLVRKMARDALELDEDDYEDEYDHPSKPVIELASNPQILRDLDLDDYSRVLVDKYHTTKKAILALISEEICNPFGDKRPKFTAPSVDTLFMHFSGETPQSLTPYMLIIVEVKKITQSMVLCKLNSGLDGLLHKRNIPNIEKIYVGAIIKCVVTRIVPDRYAVELSLLEQDMEDCRQRALALFGEGGSELDKYFVYPLFAKEINEHPEVHPLMPRTKVVADRKPNLTAMKHSLFRDISFKEAEQYLDNKEIGDFVLRPSSRGPTHIALTWKFYDKVFQHLDIVEEAHPDIPNAPPRLRINEFIYNDLDELLVMYLESTKHKVLEMTEHPKFHKGTVQNLEEIITAASLSNPKASVYGFCICYKNPGTFNLGFKLSSKSKFTVWPIKVVPKLYMLNKTPYQDVQQLINGFKSVLANMTTQSSTQSSQNQGYRQSHMNPSISNQRNSMPHSIYSDQSSRIPNQTHGPPPMNPPIPYHGHPRYSQPIPRQEYGMPGQPPRPYPGQMPPQVPIPPHPHGPPGTYHGGPPRMPPKPTYGPRGNEYSNHPYR